MRSPYPYPNPTAWIRFSAALDAAAFSGNELRCTTKLGKIFLHLFRWPATGRFELPGLQSNFKQAYLLANREELKLDQLP